MKGKFSLVIIVVLFCCFSSQAQDTLPNFTVRDFGKGKAQISWVNNFDKLVQLTVQRSFDSTGYFKTIFSTPSPWLPQNGFVDNNVPVGYKVFYRIQYVFEGGSYFFTKSKSPTFFKPVKVAPIKEPEPEPEPSKPTTSTKPEEKRIVRIYKRTKDTLIAEIDFKQYRRYKDSVSRNSKDTLFYMENDEVIIKPFVPKPVWKASIHVFTNDKGYVRVMLPLAKQKHYRIVFFEEDGSEAFQIKHVKEAELLLDKANFLHAGWFFFELFEDDKLKEKNKFYLSKD